MMNNVQNCDSYIKYTPVLLAVCVERVKFKVHAHNENIIEGALELYNLCFAML
jgi:hypothetical protein